MQRLKERFAGETLYQLIKNHKKNPVTIEKLEQTINKFTENGISLEEMGIGKVIGILVQPPEIIGSSALIAFLLEKMGAEISKKELAKWSLESKSILQYVIERGDDNQLVDLLLTYGANPYQTDENGESAFSKCIQLKKTELQNKFLEIPPKLTVKELANLLGLAVQLKDISLIGKLCSIDNTLTTRTALNTLFVVGGEHTSPLILAIEGENVGVLDALTRQGADIFSRYPNDCGKDGKRYSPLSYAINLKNKSIVHLLMQRQITENNAQDVGLAMLQAVKNNDAELVQKLCQLPSPRISDELDSWYAQGRTSIMIAVQQGNADIVRELLKRDASPHLKDNSGKNSFDIAFENLNSEISMLLAAHLLGQLTDPKKSMSDALLQGIREVKKNPEALTAVWIFIQKSPDAGYKKSVLEKIVDKSSPLYHFFLDKKKNFANDYIDLAQRTLDHQKALEEKSNLIGAQVPHDMDVASNVKEVHKVSAKYPDLDLVEMRGKISANVQGFVQTLGNLGLDLENAQLKLKNSVHSLEMALLPNFIERPPSAPPIGVDDLLCASDYEMPDGLLEPLRPEEAEQSPHKVNVVNTLYPYQDAVGEWVLPQKEMDAYQAPAALPLPVEKVISSIPEVSSPIVSEIQVQSIQEKISDQKPAASDIEQPRETKKENSAKGEISAPHARFLAPPPKEENKKPSKKEKIRQPQLAT